MDLNRRQALRNMAIAIGAAFVGPRLLSEEFLRGVTGAGADFSADEVALLDEIADTMLPETKTPGAKAAQCGACMALIVRDCFETEEQAVFVQGLAALRAAFAARFGTDFMQGAPADRLAFLNKYHRAGARGAASRAKDPVDQRCFRHLRQLAVVAYFTSEIGCTQALRFVEVPGGYDGNAPYRPGDRNWFGETR